MFLLVPRGASGVDVSAPWGPITLWVVVIVDRSLGLLAVMLAMADWLYSQEHLDRRTQDDQRRAPGRPRLSRGPFRAQRLEVPVAFARRNNRQPQVPSRTRDHPGR